MLGAAAQMMDAFNAAINGGFERIHDGSIFLVIALATMGFAFAMFASIFRHAGLMGGSFALFIMAGFYKIVLDNVPHIGEMITRSAVGIGLAASGSGMNVDRFLSTEDILEAGYAKLIDLNVLADNACQASSWGCAGNLQG